VSERDDLGARRPADCAAAAKAAEGRVALGEIALRLARDHVAR
jgi:hypothetical protein